MTTATPAAATNGLLHPYRWALELLERELGAGSVAAEASPDGGTVTAAVSGSEEGREPYLVVLRDPVLGNVNGLADPEGFLAAEVGFARAWLEGKSKRRRTYG